ncbi:glutathione S-transferase N-terminal domain-containing protein [Agarilytica rhodophyticola]|uniref:glutathione S-transferase N-terminal domain-containing protein n=1 Tax=Agarilytica rhodophyticola TaxID=1737490 RepID=UPI000B3493BE|nr:glutathione S-transferase N-terminal domain-containing protein [Agarilytica rhodophyticola]
MSQNYTLYGTEFSLYTGKARAYLRYKNIEFNEVFSSLKVYKNIIIPNTGVRFIPVVKMPDGAYFQDTSAIIDTIEARETERPVIPIGPKQKLVSYLFELFADEWLVIPAMHYRWNHDNSMQIYREFGQVAFPRMPHFVQNFVGRKLSKKFSGYLPMLGVNDQTRDAIEQWFEQEVLVQLDAHFAKHRYLLGDAATLGDFALMGPLSGHLLHDPAPKKMILGKAANVVRWDQELKAPPKPVGALPTNDEIPETLLPLLTGMFRDQWPVLINTVAAIAEFYNHQSSHQSAGDNNHKPIPRALGECDFTIAGVAGKRKMLSFHQWKVQRVLDCYHSLHGEEKQSVDTLLHKVGGFDFMQQQIKHRVKRNNNKLVFE